MIEILQYGLSKNRGGIETYLLKIWEHIDHDQFHFSFIDTTPDGEQPCFFNELKESGCDFYKITPRSKSIRKNRKDLETLFQNKHFDILHFNVNTMSYITPVYVALKNECKVIIHSRNAQSAQKKRITKIMHYINRFLSNTMDINRIAVSGKAGEWLFGNSSFRVFNNGIDVEKFRYRKDYRAIHRNNISDDTIVIGNVGAFLPAKNHKFIIDIFENVIKKRNAVLWLIGEGKNREEIEEYVDQKGLSKQVTFWGNRQDINTIYSAMDVLLFPSLYEGFPNVVLESQCEGLPCLISSVITDEVCITDQVKKMDLSKDANEWANQLLKLYDRCSVCEREKSFLEIDEKGFSVDKEIKRLEEYYYYVCRQ